MSRTQKRWLVTLFALLLITIGFASVAAAQSSQSTSDRPYLGVSLRNADNGVVIQEVAADSPAAEAELQAGDQIDSVNGEDMSSARAVVEAIAALKAGDVVTLGITRDGESLTVEATLAERPLRERTIVISDFGLRYDEENKSWLVEKLGEDNPLYEAGVREGDVITAIDGEALDPQGVADLLRGGALLETHTLTVDRDGESMDIEVDGTALHLFMMLGLHDGEFMPLGPMAPRIIIPGQPGQGRNIGPGMFGAQNGRLGVLFDVLTPEIASDLGVDVTDGAVIREVVAGSPAETAGLLVDDVVTAVNGEPVDAERTLRDRVFAYEPGDTITLDVVRGDETLQLEVTLDTPEPTGPMPSGMRLPPIPTPPEVPATPQVNL